MLHRGANPNAKGEIRENERDDNRSTDTENENECTHTKGCTVLYHAVKNNYRSVCATLLEHEALADVRSYDPKSKAMELPLKIAYNTKQDDIAALLIKYMSNELWVLKKFDFAILFLFCYYINSIYSKWYRV